MTSEVTSSIGASIENQDHVFRNNDQNPEVAGLGLALAPLVCDVIGKEAAYWMMSPAEQAAMIYLLDNLRPAVSIEIGTRYGGSLQVLAKYSQKVYSLDIDPDVEKRLGGKYSNVEFRIGPSTETLPRLLQELEAQDAPVSFVLVDGDHTAEGVAADINNVLKYNPRTALFVVMHDSFNPECREGLRSAKWSDCPYVQAVELDFVPGVVNPAPFFKGQLWGGFALGILRPNARVGDLQITGRAELTFQGAQPSPLQVFLNRAKGKLLSLLQ